MKTPALHWIFIVGMSVLALHADDMINGSALVTSRHGEVTTLDVNGNNISPLARDVLQPAGLDWTTEKDGTLFVTFSNSAAIGVDASSRVKCLEYSQRPFAKDKQSFDFEPSVSKLRLQLIEGQLAIASNRLSPLSELRIQVPKGELRVHKGTCLLRYDTTGLQIIAYDGNLTYYYPDGRKREFVAAPNGVRISDQSAERQQIAESFTVDNLDANSRALCQAVQHASQRVIFEANLGTGQPPRPVLIVRPEYFEQAPIRPYLFME